MSDLNVVIISHKRAGRVSTLRHVEGCTLCVSEAQADDYARAHPGVPIVTHPDTVIGGPRKRQWTYRHFKNLMMLDDDSLGMYRIYREQGSKQKSIVPPGRCREIVEMVGATAKRIGAYFWGFGSHAHPRSYRPGHPFRFGGYTPGGAMGLYESPKLFFPDTLLPVADYWICCLNIYFHRYAFYDMRFSFAFGETYTGQGGMREYRGDNAEAQATAWLRRKFGNVIQPKKHNPGGLTKTERNPSPRVIRLPF